MSGWTTLRTSILDAIGCYRNSISAGPAEKGPKSGLEGWSKGMKVCKKVRKEERIKKTGVYAGKAKGSLQPTSLRMRCRPVTVAAVVVAATTAMAGDENEDEYDENDDDDGVHYLLSNTFFCMHLCSLVSDLWGSKWVVSSQKTKTAELRNERSPRSSHQMAPNINHKVSSLQEPSSLLSCLETPYAPSRSTARSATPGTSLCEFPGVHLTKILYTVSTSLTKSIACLFYLFSLFLLIHS